MGSTSRWSFLLFPGYSRWRRSWVLFTPMKSCTQYNVQYKHNDNTKLWQHDPITPIQTQWYHDDAYHPHPFKITAETTIGISVFPNGGIDSRHNHCKFCMKKTNNKQQHRIHQWIACKCIQLVHIEWNKCTIFIYFYWIRFCWNKNQWKCEQTLSLINRLFWYLFWWYTPVIPQMPLKSPKFCQLFTWQWFIVTWRIDFKTIVNT